MKTKKPPTPDEIRAARKSAGLTQTKAAGLISGSLNAWQRYEAPLDAEYHRQMRVPIWELFQLKIQELKK